MRSLLSSSSPIDTHTSVVIKSLSSAALFKSSVKLTLEFRTFRSVGQKPFGHATESLNPISSEASI